MSLSEKRQGKNAQILKYVNKFIFKKNNNSYAFRLISHVTCIFKLFYFITLCPSNELTFFFEVEGLAWG